MRVSFVAKKKSLVVRATLEQLGLEVGSDLIGCLADGRADGAADALTPGPLALHLGDRGLDDAGDCPAPACVRGGNNARLRVGEQQRRTVRSQDGDGETGRARHDGVGFGAPLRGHWPFDAKGSGAVHLIERDKVVSCRTQMVRDAGAVLCNVRSIIRRARPAVEARIESV